MTARCDFSDLPVDGCSHCTGRVGDEAPRVIEVTAVFKAHYPTKCTGCGERIREFDVIARTTDGDYVCGECIP